MQKAEFKQQQYGAVVATICETDSTIVEVCARDGGKYDLTIHQRRGETDTWDDLTAHLTPEQFEKLGTVANHIHHNSQLDA